MPIQLNYTDANSGVTLPNSYWYVASINIDYPSNSLQFNLFGHPNLAAKNAGKRFFTIQGMTITFAQLGLTKAATINQIETALYTFALTYVDPITGVVFFQGGTIV